MNMPVEPTHIKLSLKSGFISPSWYRRCMGREFIADVVNTEVIVDGETFVLDHPAAIDSLPKKVFVFVGRNITCVDFDKQNSYTEAKEKLREAAAQKEQENINQRRNKLRELADEFNKKINLPVRWSIGYKDVLSGLSERSDGTGMNKATVYHVTVREPLDVGRLKRNAFSFLCTAASGNDGKDWSGCGADPVHHYDGNGQPYTPKPTCKACLKLLERFTRDE